MNLQVCGVNHQKAGIEIRERLSLSNAEQVELICVLKKIAEQCVVISTCNRTEIYTCHAQADDVKKALCDLKKVSFDDFYCHNGIQAVRHLFEVSCGLNSMILGEDQILAQVRQSYSLAVEQKSVGTFMNVLFREAISTAKCVKTNTTISRNSLSVATLAVKAATDCLGRDLCGKTLLLIGLGKIGIMTVKNFISWGIGKIYIANRSKTTEFSDCDAQMIKFSERYSVIDQADIVISATSSPHYTLFTSEVVKSVTDSRKRVFIDLAVPRDIEETIADAIDAVCYNIDTLRRYSRANLDKRLMEVDKVNRILEQRLEMFEKDYIFRKAMEHLADLQCMSSQYVEQNIGKILDMLENVSQRDKNIIQRHIRHMFDEILHMYVYSLKDRAAAEDLEAYYRCLRGVDL